MANKSYRLLQDAPDDHNIMHRTGEVIEEGKDWSRGKVADYVSKEIAVEITEPAGARTFDGRGAVTKAAIANAADLVGRAVRSE